jgi:hypothetical protein
MALKKALVIVAGEIQQIQSGDTLDAPVSEVDIANLTNNNASPIVIGQTVYTDAASGVDLAQADAIATTEVVGLVRDASIASAAAGDIQTDGILTATTGQWDTVTGLTGGLNVGVVYYLDPSTAGNLTETATTAVGQFVVRIGIALSTTELEISIMEPIKL